MVTQGRNNMLKYLKRFIFLLILILASACNKHISPGSSGNEAGRNINNADYERFYVEAIKQKLMGNTGEALKYFEMCIRMNKEADAAYYQMAQILSATGDIDNAKRYALEAARYDSKNVWYLMMISQIYYMQKNIDSAIVWHEKAVKSYPENENLQLNLGDLYVENGSYDKANAIFDSFDKKYGVNQASTLASVRSLMLSGNYRDAIIKIEKLLAQEPDNMLYNGLMAEALRAGGDKEGAMKVYEAMLEKNPADGQVQLALAGFLAEERKYDELFRILNTIILNEKVSKEDKISFLGNLVGNIEPETDTKSLELALLVLEASYTDDMIVPVLRVELMLKKQDFDRAVGRLEELTSINPDNYYAWEKLLLVYLDMRDFQNLTKKGEQCATRFNKSIIAKMLYATGATEEGMYDVALNELKKAEILAGNDQEMLIQVLSIRADVYYRTKDYQKAFDTYEQAINLNSNDFTILNNYAYYLAEQNMKLKEAEVMAETVIQNESGNLTFLDTYGWVLYKRGKLGEAARVFESIIGSDEKPDAEWYEHYGFILQKQKKYDKAVESFRKAMELDPEKIHLIKEIENCQK